MHLGEDDAPTPRTRSVLGPDVVVGHSAGGVAEALEAVRGGADYLGVEDGEDLPVPWFAIGGVTLEKAPSVAAAGAPGFAVVRAVLDAEDPEAAARELRSLLE